MIYSNQKMDEQTLATPDPEFGHPRPFCTQKGRGWLAKLPEIGKTGSGLMNLLEFTCLECWEFQHL